MISPKIHSRSIRKYYWWNRELTLKCKLKCYVKPMKDPLCVSPSKGNQGTTRGKEKILLTSVGRSWASYSTLIYTSELILCSTICVHSATRHNIHMHPYFLFRRDSPPKSSPTFSVRPRSSVGRVMCRSIPKSPMLPPGQTPGHLTFLKDFGQIPRYVASLDGKV